MEDFQEGKNEGSEIDSKCINNQTEGDLRDRINNLRCELIKDSDVTDEFEIEKIENIVAEIEKIGDFNIDFDVKKSFEKFDKAFLQKAVGQKRLLSDMKEDTDKKLYTMYAKSKVKQKAIKRMSIAAIVVILLIVSNFITIVLADFNMFQPIINWTVDVLNLRTQNGIKNPTILEDGRKKYSNFKYVQQDYDEKLLVPSYMPEGYELSEMIVTEDANGALFEISARYCLDDKEYLLIITQVTSSNVNETLVIERENTEVIEITVGAVDCYIFQNNNWYVGMWADKKHSYMLYSTLSADEITDIVKSIN